MSHHTIVTVALICYLLCVIADFTDTNVRFRRAPFNQKLRSAVFSPLNILVNVYRILANIER